MSGIAIAILVIIVPYTYLRWHYAKPGRAFAPYHDIKDRANSTRLLSAGFQRIPLQAERPADGQRKATPVAFAITPGGVPSDLASTLVESPRLAQEFPTAAAATEANAMFAYPIEFTCALPDNKEQLGEVHFYAHEGNIYVVPEFEPLSGALLARNREMFFRVTVPAGAIKPGEYRVTLVGSRFSRSWTLRVK
jgi:hypothetical protein